MGVELLEQLIIDKLITMLQNEYRVYEGILKLSKEKTNIIVEGRVSELENTVKLEQALVLQAGRIDKQRQEMMEQIAKEKNIQVNDVNISKIKKYANNTQKSSLEEYQNKILNIIKELNHINQLNSKLVKNSLEFIEFSLNLITEADVVSNNYGNTGDSALKSKKNFFDMKL